MPSMRPGISCDKDREVRERKETSILVGQARYPVTDPLDGLANGIRAHPVLCGERVRRRRVAENCLRLVREEQLAIAWARNDLERVEEQGAAGVGAGEPLEHSEVAGVLTRNPGLFAACDVVIVE